MAELRHVPPGRAGRLWLRRRILSARLAEDLLDRKLSALSTEQLRFRIIEERTRVRWEESWRTADVWGLRVAVLCGRRELRLAAAARPAEVTLAWASIMGARFPTEAGCQVPLAEPGERGPGSAALVAAAAAYGDALQAAVEHAAARTACAVVDAEIGATRRRLHALSSRWRPRLEDASQRLEHELDEIERADTFRLRWAARATTELEGSP
jgi:V/A-type H+/Na+-transporting ATPase subunit D